MAGQPVGELSRQWRVAGRGEDFDIAAAQHGAAIAHPRGHRLALHPVGLGGKRRQPETATRQRGRSRLHRRDKVCHMVEKNRARFGQLCRHVPPRSVLQRESIKTARAVFANRTPRPEAVWA
jgi:hypothetical protein